MNELVLLVLEQNLELYRSDPNMVEPAIETVAVAISMLYDRLIDAATDGEIRSILYDIATACILAIEETYD